jgi:hypothetical protein
MVQRRAGKRQYLWQLFRRDPDFARYYRNNIDKANKYVAELKETFAARKLYQPPHAYDPDYHIIMGYLKLI